MTENKPIMIDGVDVKECTCFSNWHTIMTGTGIVYKEVENCCTPQQKPCLDIKNCCFKKLAKQLHHKKQECEKLKEINAEIQESEIELENMKNSLFIDYMKYKQAIEDIKEIAEENIRIADLEGLNGVYRRGLAEQILQKLANVR